MKPLVYTLILSAALSSAALHAMESGCYHSMDIETTSIASNDLCRSCHTPTEEELEQLRFTAASEGGSLIEGSLRETTSYVCMSCHDGVRSEINIVPQNFLLKGDGCQELPTTRMRHPVFIPYDPSREDLKSLWEPLPGDWKDAKQVSDLLIDGQIVCISCHDPHSAKPRSSGKQAHLCTGCHDK